MSVENFQSNVEQVVAIPELADLVPMPRATGEDSVRITAEDSVRITAEDSVRITAEEVERRQALVLAADQPEAVAARLHASRKMTQPNGSAFPMSYFLSPAFRNRHNN